MRRAKTYYASKEIIKTVVTLIEGLKRFPENTEAFRWLLDLYCEEVPHTGLEDDLVTVVDACPDPEGVYAYVFDRLVRAGRHHFVKRLDRARRETARRRGIELDPWSVLLERAAAARRAERERGIEPSRAAPATSAPELAAEEGLVQSNAAASAPAAMAFAGTAAPAGIWAVGASANLAAPPPSAAAMPIASMAPMAPMAPMPPVALPLAQGAWSEPSPPYRARFGPSSLSGEEQEEALPDPDEAVPDEFMPLGALDDMDAMSEPGGSASISRDLPAHPLLLARQQTRTGTRGASHDDEEAPELPWARRRTAAVGAGRRPVMPRPAPRIDVNDVPDADAVLAMEQRGNVQRPREVVWRAQDGTPRKQRQARPRRRIVWVALALILLGVIVGLLLGFGGVFSAEQSAQPTEETSSSDLVIDGLPLAEQSLVEALERSPGHPGLQARLRWVRARDAWLSGRPAPSTDAPSLDDPRLGAWVLGASILDALTAGQSGQANAALPELRRAAEGAPSFPRGLASWLEGEVAFAGGDLTRAQLAYEKAATEGASEGALSLAEVCLRRGDMPGARRAFAELRRLAPHHPGLSLGPAALPRLEAALAGVGEVPAPGLSDGARLAARNDTRLAAWAAWLDRHDAVTGLDRAGHHPMMRVLAADQLIRAGQLDDAAQVLEAFDARHAAPALLEMHGRLMVAGFADAGRPDIALRFLPAPPESDLELRDWVNRNAELGLNIAALRVQLGQVEPARRLLALLLVDPVREPAARILALELHLEEGRVEDVRRHIDRLAQHRGALVGAAALDLYQGRTSSALAVLGTTSPGSLPSATREPHLRRLELRTRFLALADAGRAQELRELAAHSPPSPALALRLGLPDAQDAEAGPSGPTAVDDQIDRAVEALRRKDFEQASAWAERVVAVMPTHTEAHRILAYTSVAAGHPAEAVPHAQIAMKGRPEDVDLQLMAPEAEVAHGDPRRAIDMVRAFLASHPTDVRALHLLGQAYYRSRHLSRGAEDFNQRLRTVSEQADPAAAGEIHFWLGRLQKSAAGNAEGGAHLRKARELIGDRPDVLVALGDYYRVRDSNHALELYRTASEAENAPAGAHLALGRFAANRGYKDIAVDALQRYIGESSDEDTRQWASKKLEELH